MDFQTVLIGFALTLFAGLSTGIGSTLAFFTKHTNKKALSLALGFSAGVMIYVSFVEIFPEAKILLVDEFGAKHGSWLTVAAFFAGLLLVAIIDRLIPTYENPHEVREVEEINNVKWTKSCKRLMRMGVFVAIAIAIHNFPEGIATFTSALIDIKLGIPIALAIAIHNIPEGIAISMPIYCATGKKKTAFLYSLLSGFAEPLGALLAYFILLSCNSLILCGFAFAAVAGIMVFISLDELLPAAREYGEHHLAIYGLVAGMGIMALSLLFF
jgi:ZIP family zinc transporter